jgi:hypothetical protein
METVLERLRPLIDDTIEALRQLEFRADPLAGPKYSRITSVMSSAYKRHGKILEQALLECLKDCAQLRVWTEPAFKLSPESRTTYSLHERYDHCFGHDLSYGEGEKVIPVDVLVFDEKARTLRAYNVKRGNGSYDGGKRGLILSDLMRTQMLLKDYGRKAGNNPTSVNAHIVFYYGVRSLPPPLSMCGTDLDAHFRFAVTDRIEEVNAYYRTRLYELINSV